MSLFSERLGLEVLHVGEGRAHVRAAVRGEHLNAHGIAHGGFLFSVADEAFALASNSRDVPSVALSVRIDYFRPVSAGDVVDAIATEEYLGRRIGAYRVEIRRRQELVALLTGTAFRMGPAT